MPLSDNIKIVTVNCQGLATPSKRQDVFNYYKQKCYSIICMQDTHFIPESESFNLNGVISVFLTLFLQIREVFAFYLTTILSLKFI